VRSLAALLAAVALALVAAAPAPASDALRTRAEAELAGFADWLEVNGAAGYVGEVGWPDDARGDAAWWNRLAEGWYARADRAGLWVTAWATGEWWGDGYRLAVYEDRDGTGGVESLNPQALVVEAHPGGAGVLRGVSVAGGEFGTDRPLPGVPGVDYHYDTHATFAFLAGRGLRLVRIPFRWERIQPRLGEALDPGELERLRAVVARAHAAGLQVVLDVHNYASVLTPSGRLALGAGLSDWQLADLWRRLAAAFRGTPGLAGYGLMNEPALLPGGAPAWEEASRAAVRAIREEDPATLVLVPGYAWSSAAAWGTHHPRAWVEDPHIRYEAHHYWDGDASGTYREPYAAEVRTAEAQGWALPGTADLAAGRAPQPAGGGWELDLGAEQTVTRVVATWGAGDGPTSGAGGAGYGVETARDGDAWRPAGARPVPARGRRETTFPARRARRVRLVPTGAEPLPALVAAQVNGLGTPGAQAPPALPPLPAPEAAVAPPAPLPAPPRPPAAAQAPAAPAPRAAAAPPARAIRARGRFRGRRARPGPALVRRAARAALGRSARCTRRTRTRFACTAPGATLTVVLRPVRGGLAWRATGTARR